jgi:hypothetical protein
LDLFRHGIEEYWVQFSDLDSLQVWSYTCWKLGFVTNAETSPKQVFEIKWLYLKLGRYKLNSTCCIRMITDPNI